ncbi:cupin domain-containing protein [Paenibacillus apiarius]|uniref:AraC-type arabinose-binding/dimerisation domain-containing protein n=1 Tax=Paenibacillus apiarius TaxID=46240 RepID=A0ABT4DVR0_9BACL|nr:hypothetical protein [Paenibacillus apiarius]MCY9514789.1 hypothetical protein [Paenibacillus apiarius]MCY9521330.1 hypothetical protein [Paenibacillus apiarius]MCY9554046.1 hypothetical protein [Paenibacillus apiarius]MCY9560420.1 hypothetical protein [Paenibacillus apiarius]MCY9682242.1 hypothetical protein [Paenibacillus apiarius]
MEEYRTKYDLEEGMVLVLEPGKMHRSYRPTETETEVYWIHFQYPLSSQPMLVEKNNWQQPLLKRTDQDTAWSCPSTLDRWSATCTLSFRLFGAMFEAVFGDEPAAIQTSFAD